MPRNLNEIVRSLIRLQLTPVLRIRIHRLLGLPSESGSISQRYGSGSGSFYHQANKVRKILIPIVLWFLHELLILKDDVNVPSKSDVLKVTDENSMIRIRTKISWICNTGWRQAFLLKVGIPSLGAGRCAADTWGTGQPPSSLRWVSLPPLIFCFRGLLVRFNWLTNGSCWHWTTSVFVVCICFTVPLQWLK